MRPVVKKVLLISNRQVIEVVMFSTKAGYVRIVVFCTLCAWCLFYPQSYLAWLCISQQGLLAGRPGRTVSGTERPCKLSSAVLLSKALYLCPLLSFLLIFFVFRIVADGTEYDKVFRLLVEDVLVVKVMHL